MKNVQATENGEANLSRANKAVENVENNGGKIGSKEINCEIKMEVKDPSNESRATTRKLDQKSQKKLKKWKKRMKNQPKSVITLKEEDQPEFYKDLLPKDEREETEMPRTITVFNYINACEKEVEAMLVATKSHSGSKTALQVLPRHLRRRAASHNIKRLPRRLRNLALQQSKDQNEKKDSSNICRRKRRRNIDLQNEFAQRKGKQGWLETHMWHAKRFHMSESTDPHYSRFESRVPLFPNDKSFRSCYRAVAKHCLIQDVSYLKCVQLSGQQNNICKLIYDITMDNERHILTSDVLQGKNEAKIMIFGKSVNICVGPATLMFEAYKQENMSAWLWFNPIMNKQVSKLLKERMAEHLVLTNDISGGLVRFRLSGPKSSVTLLSTLKPFAAQEIAEPGIENGPVLWLNDNKVEHTNQTSKFNSTMKAEHQRCFSDVAVSDISPHDGAILSLIVNDSRCTLPLQKTTPTFKQTTEDCGIETEVNEASSFSLLWDSIARDQVAASRLPDHIVSTRRNEDKLCADEKVSTMVTPVPVVLIRRSGFQSAKEISSAHSGPPNHFASGWDFICPQKWGTAFWVPFIYHRCHAGGMRETERCHLECKSAHFPYDFPDTEAGSDWWKHEKKKKMATYYRKPPAKRPNYTVLGSPFPFAPEWDYLWNGSSCDSLVSGGDETSLNGEREILQKLESNEVEKSSDNNEGNNLKSDSETAQNCEKMENESTMYELETLTDTVKISGNILLSTNGNETSKRSHENDEESSSAKKLKTLKPVKVLRNNEKLNLLKLLMLGKPIDLKNLEFKDNILVCVSVATLNKGSPSPVTMLCTPSCGDMEALEAAFNDPCGKGVSNCVGPQEPKHWDPYRKECKLAKKEKKKLRNQNTKPDKFQVFPTRKIIGFVTSGDFLFSYASGGGIGFVSIDNFLHLVETQSKNMWLKSFLEKSVGSKGVLALMRSADSNQYRFVLLDIVS